MHEDRAKYSSDELAALGKKGQAFKNAEGDWSYPIADHADLKNAIRAVGRGGADHDAIRRYVIRRAKALDETDLLPENWTADGSLDESKGAVWTVEQRETANDVFTALQGAIEDYTEALGPYCYAWVQDWYADGDAYKVVYYSDGNLWAASFEFGDGGKVTLGESTKVRPVTTYVERSDDDPMKGKEELRVDADLEAGPQGGVRARLATRTLEWRQERAPHRGERETRQNTAAIELREEGDVATLVSYASLFNTPYTVGGGAFRYEESVAPGAFKRTLGNTPDVVFRPEHSHLPLGRTSSGTLRLTEDDRGLRYEVDLDLGDPDARALIPKIRRGDLTESSFAFRCNDDAWNDDYSERTLKACDLHRGDVSIVTFGASQATGQFMSLRAEEALEELRALPFDEFLGVLVQWRDHTLLPLDERAGRVLSGNSMDVLTSVLLLVSGADDNVDQAQQLLSDFMGVPNPDMGDGDEPDDDEEQTSATGNGRKPVVTPRDAEFLFELRKLRGV